MQCRYCGIFLSRRNRRIEHERLHQLDNTKQFYICWFCGRSFNQKFGENNLIKIFLHNLSTCSFQVLFHISPSATISYCELKKSKMSKLYSMKNLYFHQQRTERKMEMRYLSEQNSSTGKHGTSLRETSFRVFSGVKTFPRNQQVGCKTRAKMLSPSQATDEGEKFSKLLALFDLW